MLLTRHFPSRLLTQASRIPKPSYQSLRFLSTTPILHGKDNNMSSSPPKHEMAYFPKLTSDVRAFGQFRKVLHTGLFSQLVSMEIPVGGDIGDEVHTVDQVLIFTSGEGRATVAGKDQVSSSRFLNVSANAKSMVTDMILHTGHQSLRRGNRARWHAAPVHQHL
jgi:hypothetical protein